MYWANMILGLALIVAPFALGYQSNPAAMWSSIVLGAVVAGVSGFKALTKGTAQWEGWLDVLVGVVAVLVPFAMGFGSLMVAVWSCMIVGALVAILAGYQLYRTGAAV